MAAGWIDLFFLLRGRIGRQAWWLGSLAVALAAGVGVALLNDAFYDESANKVLEAPTMGAFLWVALCVFSATTLTAKRLNDRGRPRWLGYGLGLASTALTIGWGLGFFLRPLAPGAEALVFWALVLAVLPLLVECALLPGTGV